MSTKQPLAHTMGMMSNFMKTIEESGIPPNDAIRLVVKLFGVEETIISRQKEDKKERLRLKSEVKALKTDKE